MLKRNTLLSVIVFVFYIAFSYLAFAQPTSIECLVRKYDGPSGRRAGDIVSVKQLPHKGWGKCEGPPDYVIVKIDGVSVKGFSQYHVRHGKLDENDISEKPERVRSRFRFNLDNLPTAVSGRIAVSELAATTNLIDRRVDILLSR